MSKPVISVRGGVSTLKVRKGKTLTTTFLITLNSNKHSSEMDPEVFAGQVEAFASKLNNYLDFKQGTPQSLIAIDFDYQVEVGGKFGRTHSHAIVELKHSDGSFIHLDRNKIVKDWNEAFGYQPHVDIKYLKNGIAQARNYIKKYSAQ
jgi:hypothetical protein